MGDLLVHLAKRLEELKVAQSQAIHTLGVITGRIEEIELLQSQLVDTSDPTNRDGGAPAPPAISQGGADG